MTNPPETPAIVARGLTMRYVSGPLKTLAGHDIKLQTQFSRWLTEGPKPIRTLLSLGFESHHALDRLDLTVPQGGIYGFLGQNGAGKTTTIKILVGLLEPVEGEAFIFGKNVRMPDSRSAVGFMPENPYFYEYLTSLETMQFYGALSSMPTADCKARSIELLERFGLKDAANRKVRGFSKGMRQRLGLAQALLHDPQLVILDEPMSGLDPLGRKAIRDAILDIAARGKTVFFSSHILSDVQDICDRVCLIHHGKKIADGRLDSLLEQRVQSVALVVRGLSPDAVARFAATAQSHRTTERGDWFRYADPESADAAARAAAGIPGATLVALTPEYESLEAYFVRKTASV